MAGFPSPPPPAPGAVATHGETLYHCLRMHSLFKEKFSLGRNFAIMSLKVFWTSDTEWTSERPCPFSFLAVHNLWFWILLQNAEGLQKKVQGRHTQMHNFLRLQIESLSNFSLHGRKGSVLQIRGSQSGSWEDKWISLWRLQLSCFVYSCGPYAVKVFSSCTSVLLDSFFTLPYAVLPLLGF